MARTLAHGESLWRCTIVRTEWENGDEEEAVRAATTAVASAAMLMGGAGLTSAQGGDGARRRTLLNPAFGNTCVNA
ncbi:hypothetical protein ACFWBF_36760 [Streptomyces sp. NPDC060028]|uniref:hypothetical protein n=1 Tax=Streptomyces sp. NPDC060028 TaxID=3347041 RepID=UPI00368E558A